MYRMRRLPPPDSVTRPPPSSTMRGPCALRTFAVAFIVMVTAAGPQWKAMTPPAATAFTTASEVQLAGVPLPMTRSGCDVSTGRASAGIEARPFGLPGDGGRAGGAVVGGAVDGTGVVEVVAGDPVAPPVAVTGGLADPQATIGSPARTRRPTAKRGRARTG